jgi:hypothetical protein
MTGLGLNVGHGPPQRRSDPKEAPSYWRGQGLRAPLLGRGNPSTSECNVFERAFSCFGNVMKPKPAGTRPTLTDALHSLAAAIAIVLFAHPVFWMAGQGIAAAGKLGG